MKRVSLLFVKTLVVDVIVSVIMALIVAFIMLQTGMKDETVKKIVVAIYVISAFVGGLIAGREMKVKKYIWGMISGFIYFVMIFIISSIVSGGAGMDVNVMKCIIASVVGGGIGGMMS